MTAVRSGGVESKGRICIVTAAHLSRNPRVVREAEALFENGYDVTVLAPVVSQALRTADAELIRGAWTVKHPVRLVDEEGFARANLLRVRKRVAVEAVRTLGAQLPGALGYGLDRLLSAARRENADLYIVHLEAGAWVGCQLLRDGRTVGADFEDWYSEDLLPEARVTRPSGLLASCEQTLMRRAAYVSTTSHALAGALAARYAAPMPAVVYNASSLAERSATGDAEFDDGATANRRPSLYWVSQTIGRGRGLETLFTALARVTIPTAVHLRGDRSADTEQWLRSAMPADRGHTLHFHDLVAPHEMLASMRGHDIGLALEQHEPPSRDLTVTNKILHYMLGGLAVVATATSGQLEIAAAAPRAVTLCDFDAASLAAALDNLVTTPRDLAGAKLAAWNAATDSFCWERQVPTLLDCVERALAGARRAPVLV